MAEEEKIREHALKALQTLTDKKKGWKEKTKDFLWEIFIIVVAINLTLWFHGWNEKRHERELEKNFLIGIKDDLDRVESDLKMFLSNYQGTINYYDSIWTQISEHRIDTAFIDNNSLELLNTLYFTYDNSRFESFKSSGYLRLIENTALSLSITQLYSKTLPWRETMDKTIFDDRQRDFTTYIGSKAQIDSSGKVYVSKLLNNPDFRYHIFIQGLILRQMKDNKQYLITTVDKIVVQIDQELKKRFNYNEL